MVSLFLIKFPRPSFAGFRILSEHWCTGFEIQLYLDKLIKAASQCIYAEYVFRDEKERGKPWRIAKERGSEPQYGLKYEASGEQLETQKVRSISMHIIWCIILSQLDSQATTIGNLQLSTFRGVLMIF